MQTDRINRYTLLGITLVVSGVFLSMIHQFLMAIFMAGLFSAMVSPVHKLLTKKLGNRQTLASLLTITGIIGLVLIPLAVLITIIIGQAVTVSQSVTPWIQDFINEPSLVSKYLEKLPYYDEILPYRDIIIKKSGQLVGTVSSFLINSLSSFTKVTINAVFSSIIMLYVMFYFLNEGKRLLVKILYFLPLRDQDEQKLLERFTSVTRATIKGTLIIGIMQGGVCGLGFALADIQGPFFWGTVMAVMSIVPVIGTAAIWFPAMIIMAISGNFTAMIILLVVCGLVAGNLDNLVRPRLVGKDTEMHDLFVLFGTLGGISMFGILGIIIGPLITALFITLWDIYGDVFSPYLPKVEMFDAKNDKETSS